MRTLRLALLLLLAGGVAMPLAGQSQWTLQLVMDPVPSPFLSDWEATPSIAEIIVTNGTSLTTDVTFHYTVSRNSQVLLRGVTDPQTVPAGAAVTFDATSSFGGRADWDRSTQDMIARTGRLPEGNYEVCVTTVDPGGFVLIERQCVRFSTQYPDPPALVFPLNGDTVTTQNVLFEWLPVTGPPQGDARIGYVLQIAEVNTAARQLPEVALSSNILHYFEPNLTATSHQYPVGAQPLVPGHTYAWRVQALDGDGRPIAANQGRSETWTFVYSEPEALVEHAIASIVLSPRRDTLRYAGDTARYEARLYDADNVEIHGKRVQWRVLDTTVVRVDSAGIVTGVSVGETRVVASVGGVADSALSVMPAASGLVVHFVHYDAATDKPSLLELLESGSFDDVIPKLMELLQSGELRIPVPRLPGVEQAQTDGNERDDDGTGRGHGPAVGTAHGDALARAVESCDDASSEAVVHLDRERKVWALRLSTTNMLPCLLQGNQDMVTRMVRQPDTLTHGGVLFAISWHHPGVPRAVLVLKGILSLPLPLPLTGPVASHTYVVLNVSRSVTLESALLPAAFSGFFGDESFDVGTGLTVYQTLRCRETTEPLCQILGAINPDDPEITLQLFAGITASETSVNTTGVGHSLARGFSIQAQLPVRKYDFDVGAISLDSTQAGLMFAVQDSMVEAAGVPVHNWSIGVAPTVTVWLTGSRGNSWQVDASVGLEWDPKKENETLRPKLVVSAQLAQVWQLWWLRLGNPQLVFTTPIGPRREREATTFQLSGTWGFGENGGVGVTEGGGGDVRGDVGGGATGGAAGFEEMGRGQITFTSARPATFYSRSEAYAKWQDARKAFSEQEEAVAAAQRKVDRAKERVAMAQSNYNPGIPTMVADLERSQNALRAAESELATASVQRENARADREQTRQGVLPPTCWKTVRERCINWSASLSAGNGALLDLIVMSMRAAGSSQ